MKLLSNIFRFVGHVWAAIIAIVVISSMFYNIYAHGWFYTMDLYSPLKIANFLLSMALVSPSLILYVIGNKFAGRNWSEME